MSKPSEHPKPAKKIGFALKPLTSNQTKLQNKTFEWEDSSQIAHKVGNRTEPLVIPLAVPAYARDDQEAIDALLAESNERTKGSTKANELIIQGLKNDKKLPILLQAKQSIQNRVRNHTDTDGNNSPLNNDKDEFQSDLNCRAEDVSIHSQVYEAVPIAEFGAAMLRGMGWKEDNKNETEKIDEQLKLRHHRLGLGAKVPVTGILRSRQENKRHRAFNKPGSLALERMKEEEEAVRSMKQQIQLAEQKIVQVGSIVYVSVRKGTSVKKCRAKMIKISGVPGLNRVLVRFEGKTEDESVLKGDVEPVDECQLKHKPFRDALEKKDGHQSSSDRQSSSTKRRRIERQEKDDDSDDSNSNPHHWLVPKIRVRVITKKIARGRHYKEKGVVLDILSPGLATVQMQQNNEILEIQEKYLQTALPKVGGIVIVLDGVFKNQKGKLVEKIPSSKGLVQLFENMKVVQLSLDFIAEFLGNVDEEEEYA